MSDQQPEVKLYQVKAWVNGQEIIEDYSTYDEALKRYGQLVDDPECDAAYVYLDGRQSHAWDRGYNEYLDRAAQEEEERRDIDRRNRGWG